MDIKEAKIKIANYCAYQERAPKEVEEKLLSFGLKVQDIPKIIKELIDQGFLNEDRFARAYASGKFRNNKWGKHKIRQHLIFKGIDKEKIETALNGIDPEAYHQIIQQLIIQKKSSIDENDSYIKNQKISAYLLQKGFESEAIWENIKKLIGE